VVGNLPASQMAVLKRDLNSHVGRHEEFMMAMAFQREMSVDKTVTSSIMQWKRL